MRLSEKSAALLMRFSHRLIKESGGSDQAKGIDPIAIVTFIETLAPIIGQLFALCKKTPPESPPVPSQLAAKGVTQETYKEAFESNWGATQAWNENRQRYAPTVVSKSAKQIAEKDNTKKKLAKPAAVTCLSTAHHESVDDIALTLHETRLN